MYCPVFQYSVAAWPFISLTLSVTELAVMFWTLIKTTTNEALNARSNYFKTYLIFYESSSAVLVFRALLSTK